MIYRFDPEARKLHVGVADAYPARNVSNPAADVPGIFQRRAVRVPLGESDYTLSVIWGSGTYSTNHGAFGEPIVEEPSTVEVAVLSNDADELIRVDDDTVVPYVSVEEFPVLVEKAMLAIDRNGDALQFFRFRDLETADVDG